MAHGFFRYLRLKIIITLLRALVGTSFFLAARRDRLQSIQYPQDKIACRRMRIPSRDKNRSIAADLYLPPSQQQQSSSSNKPPILINWHGSGFVIPSLNTDEVFCRRIACETGAVVLDADYRKAPEYPFPAAVHDVEDTLRWVAGQTDQFDLSRLAVSGFSAGGNLALVAATSLQKALREQLAISAVITIYPVTDISIPPESKFSPRPDTAIPPRVSRLFDDCYCPDPAMRKDPLVSPSLADKSEFPSTVVIITCEWDSLAPEALALAEELKQQGQGQKRKVVTRVLEGVPHRFDKGVVRGTKEWERREEAYALVVETLKETFRS